jgi:hypothetical protein
MVLPMKSVWLLLKGDQPQPAQWRAVTFDDTGWTEAKAPIGYGESAIEQAGGFILEDMRQEGGRPGYASIFLRARFQIQDPYPVESLVMRADYDDGFVAYLNGEYLIHQNMSTTNNPPHNTLTPADHEYTAGTAVLNVSSKIPLLRAGENVISVQVHNTSLTSSDLYFDASLEVGFLENPFPCLVSPSCADLGDGVVQFAWGAPGSGALENVVIREGEEQVAEVPSSETSVQVPGVEPGEHTYRLFGVAGAEECYGGICQVSVSAIQLFVRGDVSDDGRVNLLDPLFLAHYIFQNGEAPTCVDTGDTNDDGLLNIADVIMLLAYLYESGDQPLAPGPQECGPDGSLDTLPKCEYTSCP